VAPWDRYTPWAAKRRVAGPALLERGLELIEETLGPRHPGQHRRIALKEDALDVAIEEWSQVLSVNLDGSGTARRSSAAGWSRAVMIAGGAAPPDCADPARDEAGRRSVTAGPG
jgi:hypothetical protein